jgi:hypothetical protein
VIRLGLASKDRLLERLAGMPLEISAIERIRARIGRDLDAVGG